jgi:hypothetical protein
MMKQKSVKVFYAGIPAKNTNPEKEDVLRFFHAGVGEGGHSQEIREMHYSACDLAVIQGWVHPGSESVPHLNFRRKVIEGQKKRNKKVLAIDSNLFLYKDPGNTMKYLRFSLNDVFPTTGEYFWDNPDPKRWEKIRRDLGITLKDYTNRGSHILICLQRNKGWSMGGIDVMQWCRQTIETIQSVSDRPIIVRAHPGDKRAKQYLRLNYPKVRISNRKDIMDDFRDAWAVVTYNSSPGVAAAIEGIPVFVTDPNPLKSQAYDIANLNLAQLEKPNRPDRQQWIEKISMSHYNFVDLRNGAAWEVIRNYI